jgi:hypothetical protein
MMENRLNVLLDNSKPTVGTGNTCVRVMRAMLQAGKAYAKLDKRSDKMAEQWKAKLDRVNVNACQFLPGGDEELDLRMASLDERPIQNECTKSMMNLNKAYVQWQITEEERTRLSNELKSHAHQLSRCLGVKK